MTPNQKASVVAYYLARFNHDGLEKLGYQGFTQAYLEIANALGVKKNYVKLRRDEFDVAFPWRRGWKRPMGKYIRSMIEKFECFNEFEMRVMVQGLLSGSTQAKEQSLSGLENALANNPEEIPTRKFVSRAITGTKAEAAFSTALKNNEFSFQGELIDRSAEGCGYDFELIKSNSHDSLFFEIKGLAENKGGIQLTSKEWQVADELADRYYLVIVRNVSTKPDFQFIVNPASTLNPKLNSYTVVQLNWSVTDRELREINQRDKS